MASGSSSIASRLRRRIPSRRATAATASSASATSHGRVTRRSIAQICRNHKKGEEDDGDETSMTDISSEDSDEDGNGDETDRFPPKKRPVKRLRTVYHGESSSRPKRQLLRHNVSELSDESQSEGKAYISAASDGASQRRKRASASSGRNIQERNHNTRKKLLVESPGVVAKSAHTKGTKADSLAPDVASIRSPPWNTLPYLVLSRIFTFASADLDTVDSVHKFVAISRTCRAFAEPVLRALYECPPLLSMNMAHALVDLLDRPPSTTTFDYRCKVKVLRINVGSIASRVYKGRHLDIPKLVSLCPRLTGLELLHDKDSPPYRQLSESLRWEYPRGIFEALGAVSGSPDEATGRAIRLRSWHWNRRMMGRELSLENIEDIHLSPPFASLRKICFTNYQRSSLNAKNAEDPQAVAEDTKQAETFAGLLKALPDLVHLVIESSTIANEFLLPLLPKSLKHLELVNCWDVSAAFFSEYLLTHGHKLRSLALHHNQSLSLAFLPILGESCPDLESLQMRLAYYNHHAFYNDSNPLYDSLLLESQVPTWPPGIQVIELEQLRKWEPSAAEVFFQSLVDSAPQMSSLRILAVKAMLDIPWRQRCEMRDRWEATLGRVFKRQVTAPEPANSLLYYQNKAESMQSPTKVKNHQKDANPRPQRRSHRIAVHASGSSSRTSSIARGLRKPKTGLISYREPDSDEDFDTSQGKEQDEQEDENEEHAGDRDTDARDAHTGFSSADSKKSGNLFIQGMCDVVDIRIDNQKPSETQYRMDDFIDGSDPASDNEWTGDEDEVLEYAW